MPHRDTFTFKDLFECENLYSLITAIVLLGFSFVFEHFANAYALIYLERPTSVYVGDLLLDNLPVVDLSFIIVEISLAAIVLGVLFFVFYRPRYLIFSLKALALFIAIRALFISLTHVGIYPGSINLLGDGFFDALYAYLNFQTGFFFSGHTGIPFLMALIFWNKPGERNLLLILSLVLGISVLLAHTHYSIDVLAAPFMAYGIFKISQYLFARDYELIKKK
ncbi:MAG: phosphatase PAP2-related protein [Candidatus Kaiserbacteria bacterium]|nr:phosphatase PAP2-related protein [Candidatus Kaiserbacteria bacterium]